MNNEDLMFNIALTTTEVEDIMQTLVGKAEGLKKLQSKIYNQAMHQKRSFEEYQTTIQDEEMTTDEVVEENNVVVEENSEVVE